jgi:hypothetical protein
VERSTANQQFVESRFTRRKMMRGGAALGLGVAANAFLAALSDEEKRAVLFDFSDMEQRQRWSNLPEG